MSRITSDNLDKWLFNLNEGNLSSYEKKELDQFLKQHPEYREEAEAWKLSSISEPLAPIAYEAELTAIAGSSSLYDYRRWAAAASLLLLIGASTFYIFFNYDEENNGNTVHTAFTHLQNSLNDKNSTFYSDNKLNPDKENISSEKNKDDAFFNEDKTDAAYLSAAHTIGVSGIQPENYPLVNKSENGISENQNSLNNNSVNRKNRQQVSINIKNEVKILTEKSYEFINENNTPVVSLETLIEESEKEFALQSEQKAKLPLKENVNAHVISDNKTIADNNKRRKKDRYKLDPNPSFTNLRDPSLLMTNNQLIDNYGGFSGGMVASRFSMNYRNSWTQKKEINSQNMAFSYDKLMRKLKTGVALNAFYNNYSGGMFTTMGAALTISPKFKLGRGTSIEPAVTFSYAQKNVNAARTVTGSFIEDQRGNVLQLYRNGIVPAASSAYMPDMKLGAVFQNKKFWVATSIDHLLTPKETLYNTETNMYRNEIEFKATLGTDYLHRPESGNVVSPQMSIYHHDGYTEMWLGAQARFKQLTVGASFSQFQDYLATVGYQAPAFKMFYQFDMTRSLLLNQKLGSHEVGVRFALNGNHRGSKSILNSEK